MSIIRNKAAKIILIGRMVSLKRSRIGLITKELL